MNLRDAIADCGMVAPIDGPQFGPTTGSLLRATAEKSASVHAACVGADDCGVGYPRAWGWHKLGAVSAGSRRSKSSKAEEESVIKVSVLYPNTPGCKFDMGYYLSKHMPMVQQKLGPACKRMAVEEGIAGGAPGAPATYVAMGHLYFDSTDAFQAAFAPHAQAILADIPNYTNTQPTIQISEVKL
jgi:uncharacterized protein (TIGR02118 family)